MEHSFNFDSKRIGILIANLGTPDSPTKKDLKKYLNQFLMDKRVIDFPRILWIIILKLVILNIRPKKSAKLYKKIWTENGSPLLCFSKSIIDKLKDHFDENVVIMLGMRYGSPSINEAMDFFKKEKISKILILPLYPQAGSPTTLSTFDAVSKCIKNNPWMPELRFVSGYHEHDNYINSLIESIKKSFKIHGVPEKLIFSFHGMPDRYLEKGDPYYCFCHKTTRLTAERLNLDENSYQIAFQSRFGSEEWLKPYIDEFITKQAKDGIKHIQVVSPGFSVDCLETLEEINIQYRNLFINNGGEKFEYIPCLNDSKSQIELIKSIINSNIRGWQ
ncbi:MAG: ferrochelatase [Candidatus Marinimicrobia bacterium]|nr:ferrochelatase [Candidatus Neomarinimicrobiota bacterium]|tara:strand:+ start:11973 stop:12968 length:996 start_codon:yes stop_codon:yes gene_type:complete